MNADKDQSTLERFIINEKRSNRVTLIATVLLITCAVLIAILYFENKKINDQNVILNESLKRKNENLIEKEYSLNISVKELRKKDSIIELMKKTDNPVKEKELATQLKSVEKNNSKYKIYIQYMPDYKTKANKMKSALSGNENYYIGRTEMIKKLQFNPQIRYFDEADLSEAENLKKFLKEKFDTDFEIKRIDMVAQNKQLEIWYGKVSSKN